MAKIESRESFSERLITAYIKSAAGGEYQRLPDCSRLLPVGHEERPPIQFQTLIFMPEAGFGDDTDVLRAVFLGLPGPYDLQVDVYVREGDSYLPVYSEYVNGYKPWVQRCWFLARRLLAVEVMGTWDAYYLVPMPRDLARYPLGGGV